jgi:MFS family permease
MLVGIGLTDLTFRTSQVALPLVVLLGTGSAAATGLVGGAAGIPVLLSPWWSRRLRHRISSGRAVAVCYLGEALALAAVAWAATTGHLEVALLAAAGLVLGTAEALDGPGRDALLADLGDQCGEDRALTLLTARDLFRRVSMVVGPALGGLLVARGRAVELLWVEVASVLVSAALVAGIRAVGAPQPLEEADGIWRTVRVRPEVLAGWVVRGTGSPWAWRCSGPSTDAAACSWRPASRRTAWALFSAPSGCCRCSGSCRCSPPSRVPGP